ncbi:uncharacterized protein K489DRAFT_381181 [Dissoconium aciculare CBS 342.82]|uniref:DUF1996 domain-containing protein n=1 Tax=Dissoconium aciculare CBS 342.82 TaxID=1314786 RepID=A0A6J3M6C1_9PEZI|nr:uncharacterized protein K489DRAFT_381181 [Dissoconium aciculare CBS 342.82]KAF1822422.1 hypothetical protein K489DRAFT_381181 [Dissoconium aciculare CBS 342.82]
MIFSTRTVAVAAAFFFSNTLASQVVQYTPGGDDTLVERMDSILSPNAIAAHVHQIFGASNSGPGMTFDSLRESDCTTVGSAEGDGNADDMSSYWHPSLYMEAKDGSGYFRIPTSGHKLYYRDVGNAQDQKVNPFEFPPGFRMIAGQQTLRAPNEDVKHRAITQWICHKPGGWNEGKDGGFPTGVQDCTDYPGFNGAIEFPHCWNGKDFDQANPGAHVSYPEGDVMFGPCPASHPKRLPHIFIENQFDLHKVVDKVKPDTFVLSQGDKTGFGWHMDFVNGWKVGTLSTLLNNGTSPGCPTPFYGNEDIGVCPAFHKSPVKTKNCKLKMSFPEKVDTPGDSLPGCNPISTVNPAPAMEIAALGVATSQCSLKGSSGSSGSGSSGSNTSPGTSQPTTTSTQAAPTYNAPTTFSTQKAEPTKTTSAESKPTGYGNGGNSNGGGSNTDGGSTKPDSGSSVSLCPEQNGKTYTDPTSKKSFMIDCAHDHAGGDMDFKLIFSGGLSACIATCASTSGCVDVSMSGAACYLKKSAGKSVGNLLVFSAKLIDGASSSDKDSSAGTTAAAAPAATTAAPAGYNSNKPVGAADYQPVQKNGSDDNNNAGVHMVTVTEETVVTATQWVTVYARDAPAPTGAAENNERRGEAGARHGHGHALAHIKRAAAAKA